MPDTFVERIHEPVSLRETRRSRRTPLRLAVWLGVMTVLLVIVCGGLVGFNMFREKATAQFFATMKPPATAVVGAGARAEAGPQALAAIGGLAAVHQVVVSPEVGGRVTQIAFQAG